MRPWICAAVVMVLFTVSGCAVLDTLTGSGDPAVEAGETPSTIEKLGEGAESALPWPWSVVVGGVLGYGAKGYRDFRKKQAEQEAAA